MAKILKSSSSRVRVLKNCSDRVEFSSFELLDQALQSIQMQAKMTNHCLSVCLSVSLSGTRIFQIYRVVGDFQGFIGIVRDFLGFSGIFRDFRGYSGNSGNVRYFRDC